MQTNLAFHVWWRACGSNAWRQCTAIAENDWKRNQAGKAGSQRRSLPRNHLPGRCCSRYLFLAFLTFFGYVWKILKALKEAGFFWPLWQLSNRCWKINQTGKTGSSRQILPWNHFLERSCARLFDNFWAIFWNNFDLFGNFWQTLIFLAVLATF